MSTVHTRRLSALLVASAIVLVSCGGNDSGSTSSGNRQRNAALTQLVRKVRTSVKYFDRNSYTNLALSAEGELVVWGNQAISGSLLNPPVSSARIAAIGNTQAAAIDLDNEFHAWGSNPETISTPPSDLVLSTVTSLSVDDGVVMAIDEDGKLWAWGSVWNWQEATIPDEVRQAKIIDAISANAQFNVALDDTGVVYVWGRWEKVPEVSAAMEGITAKNITLRNFTLSVVTTDGKIVEAGYDPEGSGLFPDVEVAHFAIDQWGNAMAVDTDGRLHFNEGTLIEVPNLIADIDQYNSYVVEGSPKSKSISATSARFTVLFDDGDFWNFANFAEDGMYDPDYFYSSHMVAPIAAGNYRSFAISDDYTIARFHQPQFGEMAPPDEADYLAVASGWNHALGLRKNGTVVSWGEGPDNNAIPDGISNVRDIGAGYGFSAVRDNNGQIFSWGTFQSSSATKDQPRDFTWYQKMSTGFHNIIAIGYDGMTDQPAVYAWGDNSYGQADVPSDLDASQVEDVAIGYDCAAATLSDGSVRVWGVCEANEKNIPADQKFHSVKLGMGLIAGINRAGELVAWGDNVADLGEKPAGMRGIGHLSIGTVHILAVNYEGGVYAWGPNIWGESNVPESFKPLPIPDWHDDNYDDNLSDEGENTEAQIDRSREPIPTPPVVDDTPIAVINNGEITTVTPTPPAPTPVEPINEVKQITMTSLPPTMNPVSTIGKVVTVNAAVKLLGLKKVTNVSFVVPKKVSAANARVCAITKTAVTIKGAGFCDVNVAYTDSKKKKRTKTLSLIGTP